MNTLKNLKIAVIGLGYVGLPLAVEFGRLRSVVGFDLNGLRVAELKEKIDRTMEVTKEELSAAENLVFTENVADLADANCFIITVPTPIDKDKNPDLTAIRSASKMVGKILKKDDIVIYESTVFPGCTEEECVPLLEKFSGLEYNKEFFCGYSPERINPGDKEHRLSTIVKVTSGSTPDIAQLIDRLYKEIVTAGTHLAPSIAVAEAAKVIENTQRDLNIALMNELSIIFNKLNIDTQAVLQAAGTKWNFLNFQPGLVGGHCIGVDPYYLTHKAQAIGYNPEIILAGRRLNDGMSSYVVNQLIKKMRQKSIKIDGASILIMGLTFKENCPDVRNTRILDIVNYLRNFNMKITICDPLVDEDYIKSEYDLDVMKALPEATFDGVIVAVGHQLFKELGEAKIRSFGKPKHVLFDLKHIFSADESDIRL